jgi:hypothetical protein
VDYDHENGAYSDTLDETYQDDVSSDSDATTILSGDTLVLSAKRKRT